MKAEYFDLDGGFWTFLYYAGGSLSLGKLFGIFLMLATGFALVNKIAPNAKQRVKLPMSIPAGFGVVGILMFLMLLVGLPLNFGLLHGLLFVIWTVLSLSTIKKTIAEKGQNIISKFKGIKFQKPHNFFDFSFLVLLVVVNYIVLAYLSKTLYWPVYDWDAITTFDFYGRSIAQESTMITGPLKAGVLESGVSYPPLSHLLIAYSYVLGFASPKVIYAFVILGTVWNFYAIARLWTGRLAAIFGVLLMISIPEFAGFMTLVKTNSVQILFSSIGIFCFAYFLKSKKTGFLWLSALWIALNAWTRSEGIELIAICGGILAVKAIRKKMAWKTVFIYGIACALPFLSWQIFLKVHSAYFSDYTQVSLILQPVFDGAKFGAIWRKTAEFATSIQRFGFVFVLGFAFILVNAISFRKKMDMTLPLLVLGLWGLHILLLYQLEYKADNMFWLLRHSYKRYIMNYVPLLAFFVATSQATRWLSLRYERLIFDEPDPILLPPANISTEDSH